MPTPRDDRDRPCAVAGLADRRDPSSVERCDWLDLARSLAPHSVDLLYADPPFNTGATQHGPAGSYPDAWASMDEWTDWLRERLIATLPALKPTGSVLLHVDWRSSHHARAAACAFQSS